MSRSRPDKNLEKRVHAALAKSRRGPLKPMDLQRELDLPRSEAEALKETLARMEKAGKIYKVKGGRYGIPEEMDLVVGTMSLTKGGDGFVRPESGERDADVYVPNVNLATAMDGDRVTVRIESRPKNRSRVGRVIKILERSHTTVVGTLHEANRYHYVVALDRRVHRNIMVPHGDHMDAEDGDVVVIRYVSYGDSKLSPVGEVEAVLGKLDDPGVDILAVAHSYGLALEFPEEVMKAAQEAASTGMDDPGAHRVDRTDRVIFTIDPADAKDHDDALSIRPLDAGGWEVGVHIADVAHFVPEGGVIDQEALARGNSVYMVDRVIPMLPEQLSGDVCSLRSGVDRFALSVWVEMDAEANIHGHRFERTVINCTHSLSYEQAQQVLDGEGSVDPEVDDALWLLDDLARKIREKRMARGALDLDLPEARVILDAEGDPLDIQRQERLEAHRLVEDYMIMANELVARTCEARKLPVLYRIHEPPERERADELRDFIQSLGHHLPQRQKLQPKDVQTLLEAVKGRPDEHLVATVVLRSLKRAQYDRENLGHFGLASEAYLHYTSPIRRYPDLVVHREVIRTLVGGEPPRRRDPEDLQSVAEHASARERAASQAERDSVALKKVEFMERHLGDEFEGRVTGVQAFGFFVTLDDFFVDGLVHVNSLDDDYYRLREDSYALVGDRGGRKFQLGDRVEVRVTRVDKEARNVDFVLVKKLRQEA